MVILVLTSVASQDWSVFQYICYSCEAVVVIVVFNSREAIAAIIENIVDFYDSKNMNCIGALFFVLFMLLSVFPRDLRMI